MVEQDPEFFANVTVQLSGKEDAAVNCGMLRGLLYAIGNSNGQAMTNQQFHRGVTVSFGAAPMARKFVRDTRRLFNRRVRERLTIDLHG